MKDQEKPSVQSLERAFFLIELLSENPEGMLLVDIAKASQLHKSTAHRLLASLANMGYVKKSTQSNRYRLTLKLFELSGRVVDSIDVVDIARLPMERLRNMTQEAVHLVVRDGTEIVYVHKVESSSGSIRMFSRIGLRRPMYCTAVGKTMLAAMSESEVRSIWERSKVVRYTEHTIMDLSSLMQELEKVRKQGYATDDEENELGVRCIAIAIYDYKNKPKAAISVSAPISRMSDERIGQLAPQLIAISDEISAELGYQKRN